jgi:hypothetical protein
MKLRVRAFGLAVGVVCGLGIFAATLIDAARGAGRTLGLLNAFIWGYEITFVGAILGFIWAFVYGFIGGALIAWLYNIFYKAMYKA